MEKPHKGVISNWHLNDNRIYGVCVLHTDYTNGILRGMPLTTSTVISITPIKDSAAMLLETRNSLYVLV